MDARTNFFAVPKNAFSPFMGEQAHIETPSGTQAVRASILLSQNAASFSETYGNIYSVTLAADQWPLQDLPKKGAILTCGSPVKTLFILQVGKTPGLIHIIAAENASPSF